jgi:DNA-binding transcriptional LysR family regulator
MILRNLEYLVALAHEKHFARAAGVCNVTQPTLSAGIKQLEEELGLLIVQRGQRFEGFTPEGERILLWAQRILADTQSLTQEAGQLRTGLVGRLRLGAIPVTLPMISLLTSPFAERHPQVNITVLSLSSIEIQRGLDDFSLDAGVTYLDNEPLSGVRTCPLYRERYYLFTHGDAPPAPDAISWREAATHPLCLLTPDMQNRRIIDAHLQSVAAPVKPRIETNSVLTLCAHLRFGRWSTILPQTFLYLMEAATGARGIPLMEPSAEHAIGLVVPDREPLTPSSRVLLELAGTLDVAESIELSTVQARR